MHPFDAISLLPATVAMFLVTLSLGLSFTRRPGLCLFAALVKSACFFAYFNVFFDGTYWFWDDWRYLQVSAYLRDQGVGFTNLIESLPILFAAASGDHFIYYVHNIWAITLFGDGYFAPVALNIILTSIMAWVGAGLAEREFGWQGDLRDAFFIFLLLSPDILAWSTVMNGKDILVLLLHVITLQAASEIYRHRVFRGLLLMVPTIAILLFLRFYVPAVFAASFVAASFLAGQRSHRMWWFFAGAAAIAAFVALRSSLIGAVISRLESHLVNPLMGLPRFVMTPIPFNTTAEYAFLNLPAVFHWMMLPFLVLGILSTARLKTPFVRFFLIYFAMFVALYAVYGELQGPRQRVQLDYALAVFQFAGVIYAFQAIPRRRAERLELPA